MKKILLALLLVVSSVASAQDLKTVRIGWQIPWATQGQLVQILKHTDILKNHGLKGEFVGRTYGPLLNELAIAGEIDIVLTADQPAIVLFSKNKGWRGIGRLMYNRTSTYVPVNSPIKDMAGLKGATIGIPLGAAAERITVNALKKAGLHKDVKIINLDIKEQAPLIQSAKKGDKKWGQFDALSGFDPLPAIFEAKGWVKTLDVGKVVSLVLMNDSFIASNKDIDKKFMLALRDAYDYFRQNQKQAHEWFLAEAKLDDPTHKACEIAASIEPNLTVSKKEDIRLSFTEDDFKIMEEASAFLAPKIKQEVKVRDFVKSAF